MKKAQMSMMLTIGIGVIMLVVILGVVFSFLSQNALNTQAITNESLAITSTQVTVNDEIVTIASGLGTTAIGSVINVTFFGNGSVNTSSPPGITVGTEVNFTITGSRIVRQNNITDREYKHS